MNMSASFRKFLTFLLAAILSAGALVAPVDTLAKKAKAKTSQSAKGKKSSSSKKKGKKKSKKKKGVAASSSKKKNGASSKKKRKTRKKSRRSNAIRHKQYTPPVETPQNDTLTLAINAALIESIPENVNPGGLRVNSVKPDRNSRTARVRLNENFTYLPVTQELITHLRKTATEALPDSIKDYGVTFTVGDRSLAYYITKVDKLPEQYRKNIPFVRAEDPYVVPAKGMDGDILALWHSHGKYFKPSGGAWLWQRPLLFQIVEDTHTMSYMLPFIVPMLENAGAYVMLPRERDTNRNEVIVDNDTNDEGQIFSQPYYREQTGQSQWTTGEGEGFIYDLPDFRDTENPFENGTYRQTTTVKKGQPSVAAWYADIPEDGEYAVYVSYKSLPNSTTDARYTVNYSGGSREFKVNQTMGGGTWIYLGTFPMEAGYSDEEPVVTLTNLTDGESGTVVTADAVKIGGGMGNIARSPRRSDIYYDPSTPLASMPQDNGEWDDDAPCEEGDDDETADDEASDGETAAPAEPETPALPVQKGPAPTFRTSGLPRFLEGARYWLQWAGMPDYIYSPYGGSDDYKDDYTSRGHWVNYLAGGSRVLPGKEGLKIPIDLTMALHSDAGKRSDDSFVGTLGIYYTNGGDTYVDGTPRINSRMLTDMLMRQITGDIRQTYEPNWTRRSMWDKSYVEARVPEVPTSLIELNSHQNFADMQYSLDPTFRFTVGRSIYKALARFMAERKDRQLVIQPLPVKDFSIQREKKGHYRLEWKPTPDPLESTAMPDRYIIFERNEGELGFHMIAETRSTHFTIKCEDNEIHSFKIVAANEGGMSFPSEVLAFREGGSDPVLIVNGFTRVSGPSHFSADNMAGFDAENDFGVPYIKDISFTGYQTEFRRNAGESFGRCGSDYAPYIIAGNTFDYPAVHGESMAAAGYGFVSSSIGAVTDGSVKLQDYHIVDLILGKQKTTVVGNGKSGIRFQTFPEALQKDLRKFSDKGGKLMVSGEYVASDLYDYRAPEGSATFAEHVLGISQGASEKSYTGRVATLPSRLGSGISDRLYSYSNTLNDKNYIVERPDVLNPSGNIEAEVLMTFTDTNLPAGLITKKGKSRSAVMSVPFESITDRTQRDALMAELLKWLDD